jgi:hypothetical protein
MLLQSIKIFELVTLANSLNYLQSDLKILFEMIVLDCALASVAMLFPQPQSFSLWCSMSRSSLHE